MKPGNRQQLSGRAIGLAFLTLALLTNATPVSAQVLENEVAVFAALDKVTARIKTIPVPLNTTERFGSLKITPRVCYSRPPTEPPKTTTFVEVDEVQLDGHEERLFTGWMFAESPGLNAVEHPVFDVWLTGCTGALATASRDQNPSASGTPEPGSSTGMEPPRRRVRR